MYMHLLFMVLFLFSFILAQGETVKQEAKSLEEELLRIQVSLEEMEKKYQLRIDELQEKIEKLEKGEIKGEEKDELEALLKEAEEVASQEQERSKGTETKIFIGGQRQQQSLNPNISLTGDLIGHFTSAIEEHIENNHSDLEGRKFLLREAEFHIISNLDPYTRAKFFLGVPGLGSLHVGEAYMEWLNLPFNIALKVGKYRTQFGVLNRWHEHGLPQVDRPKVLEKFLGGEGLAGIGTAANILLPKLWAHVNELDVEVIYGGDGVSFTNEGSKQWVGICHLKNYYDLTSNAYLELGLSGAYGHYNTEANLRSMLGGIDLTYKWVPAGRSKYRTLEFRNEFIFGSREDNGNSYGWYSYIKNKLNASWWIGIRFDYTQLPNSQDEQIMGISPHLTFWQSEFVFIRLQYSYFDLSNGRSDNRVMLQSVWSMGPHKHEAY